MTRIEAHTTVRTSVGTFTAGDTGAIPDDEVQALADAGLITDLDAQAEDPAEMSYNDLRSRAADLKQTTDVDPKDYKRTTLEEYVQRHAD